MKGIVIKSIVLACVAFMPVVVYAQCKGFTKKACIPLLSPYTHNGQLNSAVLAEGETAELLLTFYSGQNYRLAVCAQEKIGDIVYRLLDTKRNVIFDNSTKEHAPTWDFKVQNTQQIIVEINVPKGDETGKAVAMVPTGCVSIIVGFKE